ncbi:hypothetical protein SUGI_0188030 [Cryptomeria japonica]|nr:hypothetical protein SUGI_0188030 [Cryptomeria japonica]
MGGGGARNCAMSYVGSGLWNESWWIAREYGRRWIEITLGLDSKQKLTYRKSLSSRVASVDGAVELVGVAAVNGKGASTENALEYINKQNFRKEIITARGMHSSSAHPSRVTKEKLFIGQQLSVQNREKKQRAQMNEKKENEATPGGRGMPSVGYYKCQNAKLREAEPVKRVGVLSIKECERKMGNKPEKPMKRDRRRPLKKHKIPEVDWHPVLDAIPELCSFK